jgi:hypothetical protein
VSEHTPGPWYVAWKPLQVALPPYLEKPGGQIWNEGKYGRLVAIVNCRKCEATQAEADARLIAASPDLLAACINLHDRAIGYTHRHMFGADEWAEITALIVKAGGTPSVCDRGCQPECRNYPTAREPTR